MRQLVRARARKDRVCTRCLPALNPKPVRIPFLRGADKTAPVSIRILRKQKVRGLSGGWRASKSAIDINSASERGPRAKRGAASAGEVCTHGSIWRDSCLRNHVRLLPGSNECTALVLISSREHFPG